MKELLRKLLINLAGRFSSSPDPKRVHEALTLLHANIVQEQNKKGKIISFTNEDRFVIFSDQHKGAKNGSDDFTGAESNYVAALDYYANQDFHYINLGDSEELWENGIDEVKKYNAKSFEKETVFLQKQAFTKVFGNHDLYWDNSPFAASQLQSIYKTSVPIYEGVLLQTEISGVPLHIFLTHGHQGDAQSDGNWFSKWFVANVWGPIQNSLQINPNTPSTNDRIKTTHNRLMYEWSAKQKNLLLITGHTHQPVFESLTHIERLYMRLAKASKNNETDAVLDLQKQIEERKKKGETLPDFTSYQPCYFNTGCCCFSDGDITGIELSAGKMRLVKWGEESEKPTRAVLEEVALDTLVGKVV